MSRGTPLVQWRMQGLRRRRIRLVDRVREAKPNRVAFHGRQGLVEANAASKTTRDQHVDQTWTLTRPKDNIAASDKTAA
jgi:hypothetical protein